MRSPAHPAGDDPRFNCFETLAEEIGTAFGGDAIRWKRQVATDATSVDDEAEIAYNIPQILRAAERFPSKRRQPILKAMDEIVFRRDEEEFKEVVEERVMEELLAIREVEAFELEDVYQTAEAEASDLLGVLEYRVALAS